MYRTVASTVLMIKPKAFGYNPETAEDNLFMAKADQFATIIHQTASKEQDTLIKLLRSKDIEVIVEDDTDAPKKPDAIFVNWLSFHNSGKVVLYPFKAPSRHAERRMDIIDKMQKEHGFQLKELVDYSPFEKQGKYLEGMGSLVIDRINKVAYSCLSTRTHRDLVERFCADFGFTPVIFSAEYVFGEQRKSLFYTNILISIGEHFALAALELIPDIAQRNQVRESLERGGKEVIELSADQARNFAGNSICLRNNSDQQFVVMSKRAHRSLSEETQARISRFGEILSSDINTIETYGGGSVGHMMAPVFLPRA
ncbi:MAG TPA: arginine deiminase-related protein [Luteibaculaceae bacterium]|nr:arginine deiminase-related protein [Luteibaculaceae bacterium]